jgi:hypothetical protein
VEIENALGLLKEVCEHGAKCYLVAYDTIATTLAEALKLSHNKQGTPCSWCEGVKAMLNHSFCSNCGRDLR